MKRILSMLVFISLVVACSSDNGNFDPETPVDGGGDPQEVTFERSTMLTNWADNIIIPSYESFVNEMNNVLTAFENFKSEANTTNLESLRAAWLTAYKSWQHVSMFEIGPAEDIDFRLHMNIYPTDSEKINGFVSSGSFDLDLPSNRDAKGFPALDYLLNGIDIDDAAIVSKYNGNDKEALLNFLDALLIDMKERSASVLGDWKDNYRNTFVANDGSSATASSDRFINDYVFYYEKFLRAGKLGIPLGVFSGVQATNTVEAFYYDGLSNELLQEALHAVQDFFNGKHFNSSTTGESMASYLISLDRQDLTDDINAQFDSGRAALLDLQSFSIELEVDPAINMLSAYDEVQKAVSMLKVDMFSAMSISVDYVDADGD